MTGFSDIKSLEEALRILNVEPYTHRFKYRYNIVLKDTDIKNILDKTNAYLQSMESLDSSLTLEFDKEFICRSITMDIVVILKSQGINKDLKVKSRERLTVTLDQEYSGFLDFCIYKQLIEKKRILTVFEVKRGLISDGLGQLLGELVAVWEQNKSKAFGFVTNAQSWQLLTYDRVEEKHIVEAYETIHFNNSYNLDIETMSKLCNVIADVIIIQC